MSLLSNKIVSPAVMLLFCVSCMLTLNVHASKDQVVLVCAKLAGIDAISLRDIRRLYLGFRSADNEAVGNAVLNVGDDDLYDAFLKNVMRMTDGSYKRKLVKRMFRRGSDEIRRFENVKSLNQHLLNNVGDISFVNQSSISEMDDIKVIQVLW